MKLIIAVIKPFKLEEVRDAHWSACFEQKAVIDSLEDA